jgi:hypothetical protein
MFTTRVSVVLGLLASSCFAVGCYAQQAATSCAAVLAKLNATPAREGADSSQTGDKIGRSAVCAKTPPIIFGSGAGDVASACGPVLAKVSLSIETTVDSSHHYAQVVDDFLRTTKDDKRAFAIASAINIIIPASVPIPVAAQASGSWSHDSRFTYFTSHHLQITDEQAFAATYHYASNEAGIQAYLECAKTTAGKSGFSSTIMPTVPDDGSAFAIKLMYAPPGGQTLAPIVADFTQTGDVNCGELAPGTNAASGLAISCTRRGPGAGIVLVTTCGNGPVVVNIPAIAAEAVATNCHYAGNITLEGTTQIGSGCTKLVIATGTTSSTGARGSGRLEGSGFASSARSPTRLQSARSFCTWGWRWTRRRRARPAGGSRSLIPAGRRVGLGGPDGQPRREAACPELPAGAFARAQPRGPRSRGDFRGA